MQEPHRHRTEEEVYQSVDDVHHMKRYTRKSYVICLWICIMNNVPILQMNTYMKAFISSLFVIGTNGFILMCRSTSQLIFLHQDSGISRGGTFRENHFLFFSNWLLGSRDEIYLTWWCTRFPGFFLAVSLVSCVCSVAVQNLFSYIIGT